MIKSQVVKELLFLYAGIGSVLCISCYPNLGMGMGIRNKKNGIGTSLACSALSTVENVFLLLKNDDSFPGSSMLMCFPEPGILQLLCAILLLCMGIEKQEHIMRKPIDYLRTNIQHT